MSWVRARFKAVLGGFVFGIESLPPQGTGDVGLAENYNAAAFRGQCAKSDHLNDLASGWDEADFLGKK